MARKRSRKVWSVRLVENGEEAGHADAINSLLDGAAEFICIVAFAKASGWRLLADAVRARVDRGCSAKFVIGTNFYQTDPNVLRALLALTRKSKGLVEVFIGHHSSHEPPYPPRT